MYFRFNIFLLIVLTTISCSTTKEAHIPAEELSRKAHALYERGDNYNALEVFEKLKDRYPFSEYSLAAELKAADATYHLGNYDEALMMYQDFEETHPSDKAAPYVLYQIGMCQYKQVDTIDRDASNAENAIKAFSKLLQSYQNTPYSQEARTIIFKLNDFLAEHEFFVASFYLRTKEVEQAKGRLEYILIQYPDSNTAVKAKEILATL
jgi:outer membrane protein assembly factor BamD